LTETMPVFIAGGSGPASSGSVQYCLYIISLQCWVVEACCSWPV